MSELNRETMVLVENVGPGDVGYNLDDHKIKRNWPYKAKKKVKMWELEELKYTSGGQILLRDFLKVLNVEHREHLDLPLIEEYLYTESEIKRMIKEDKDTLMEVMSWMSTGNKQLLTRLAVEVEIDSNALIAAISEHCGVNVKMAIEDKIEARLEAENPKKTEEGKPVVSKPAVKTRQEMLAEKDAEVKSKKRSYELVE